MQFFFSLLICTLSRSSSSNNVSKGKEEKKNINEVSSHRYGCRSVSVCRMLGFPFESSKTCEITQQIIFYYMVIVRCTCNDRTQIHIHLSRNRECVTGASSSIRFTDSYSMQKCLVID